MTVTAEGIGQAIIILDACNLNTPKPGQGRIWADIINEARPATTNPDVMAAVRRLAMQRGADSKGGTWVTLADVVTEIRKTRAHALDAGREVRELEEAPADPERIRDIIAKAAAATQVPE